jgi:transcriptional regulator with XRE-family HTH domain
MITAHQIRAARALLGIDQRRLGELAGISLATIERMESCGSQVRGIVDSLAKVIAALENAGIEFLAENMSSAGIGPGVRIRTNPENPTRKPRLTLQFKRPVPVEGSDDAA